MKLDKGSIKGIKFYHRRGFSDLKTFEEVIGKDAYQKRGLSIEPGEAWMDCGGNVGAFTLLACARGAQVHVYEPDPFNCELIERNLKINGFRADVHQAALVADERKQAVLFIGNNNNVWRNSLVRKWNDKGLKVPCLNFDSEAQKRGFDCCKMDIEGAEMPILERTSVVFDKLVYEWSFDIDARLGRLWDVIDAQKAHYEVKAAWSSFRYHKRDFESWQASWFPPCTNVFCFRSR